MPRLRAMLSGRTLNRLQHLGLMNRPIPRQFYPGIAVASWGSDRVPFDLLPARRMAGACPMR